jgi:hypothetical protein
MKLGYQRKVLVGLPERNSWYTSHRRLGEIQGLFSCLWENLSRREFELQTTQHVASRYTDNTIPTHTTRGIFWEDWMTHKKLRNYKYVVFLWKSEQSSRYSDWLQIGRSGDQIQAEVRFSAPFQTGPPI